MPVIEPGMWVECFKARNHPDWIGRLFFCEDVAPADWCPCHDGECTALFLKEHPTPYGLGGWSGCCFRPVYKPNNEIIQGLLRPVPELETTS